MKNMNKGCSVNDCKQRNNSITISLSRVKSSSAED
uniref:Uncharacterized protein n=1 Tax=Ascaris lumbricoides TaxID=6252 RepID=A0A0M3HJ99_ASCLU